MKTCTKCITVKSLNEFHWRNKARGRRNSWCKPCAIKHRIEYSKTHRAKERDQERNYRKVMKGLVDGYLREHPCVDCGEEDILVLEFDHVKGKKLMPISKMVCRFGWKIIKKEIDKCEVRCANCHRRITHKRRHGL